MPDAGLFGDEKEIGDRIAQDAVDFLGHRAIEAPQARFDVRDLRPAAVGIGRLDRGEGTGNRRVHVADDHHEIGLSCEQLGLEALQHARRLRAVAARADVQRDVGIRQVEVAEEAARLPVVVVLSRVDERHVEERRLREGVVERRDLHEVRPRATDEENSSWMHVDEWTRRSR